MNNISFEEEGALHGKSQQAYSTGKMPGMAKLLINLGIVKTEKQAFYALIVLVAIIIVFTFIFFRTNVQDSEINNFVVDKYGNKYNAQEYQSLLSQGKDPLSPNFRP